MPPYSGLVTVMGRENNNGCECVNGFNQRPGQAGAAGGVELYIHTKVCRKPVVPGGTQRPTTGRWEGGAPGEPGIRQQCCPVWPIHQVVVNSPSGVKSPVVKGGTVQTPSNARPGSSGRSSNGGGEPGGGKPFPPTSTKSTEIT